MIDKDFGELRLLQKEFPLARVLICHFHLKQYLRTEMSKKSTVGVARWTWIEWRMLWI